MCSSISKSHSTDLFLTASHRRIIWSITSSQLSPQRRPIHCFISVSKRTTHPTHGLPHPTQGHTTFHLRLKEEPHTHLMGTPNSWASSPHTREHAIPSPSQRGTTHPSHGLPLRPTHSVCVLEVVSRNCNHQHSLSSREAFSTRPSFSRKYSNFVLVVIINSPSQLGRYSPPGQVSHGSTRTSS
jgi:hypothetical protein